ncbi:MAG: hypothetical protein BZY88_03480 [SAR202 cluster bacterium Io17-Chloro-G9]|nr:MAG: hypothetical protein BZY88_03480 [SAR202 cluster bacterium Io17-Chloro-G9]
MPPFQNPVEIGPPDGSRFQRLIALVDAGITYAVFPAPVLTMLGIEPAWSQIFQSAAGGEQERQMAEIKVRLEGRERTTVCVFGDADSQPALGKHTLETFGLAADEAGQRLVEAGLFLA